MTADKVLAQPVLHSAHLPPPGSTWYWAHQSVTSLKLFLSKWSLCSSAMMPATAPAETPMIRATVVMASQPVKKQ